MYKSSRELFDKITPKLTKIVEFGEKGTSEGGTGQKTTESDTEKNDRIKLYADQANKIGNTVAVAGGKN
jgi:hypothetical protein